MSSEEQSPLNYILALLNYRRERYKLWWNALIGLIVALGAGLGIAMISEQNILADITRRLFILVAASPMLALSFLSIFFELHLIDDLSERIVFNFFAQENSFYEKGQHSIVKMLQFIDEPTSHWSKWKRSERHFITNSCFYIITGIFIFFLDLPHPVLYWIITPVFPLAVLVWSSRIWKRYSNVRSQIREPFSLQGSKVIK